MAKPTTLLPLLLVLSATLALSHNSGNDPFFFDEESFRTLLRTQQGSVRILERFSKLSDSLIGIDNYRLVILEANPYTAISPHYFDATEVLIVLRGTYVASSPLLHYHLSVSRPWRSIFIFVRLNESFWNLWV